MRSQLARVLVLSVVAVLASGTAAHAGGRSAFRKILRSGHGGARSAYAAEKQYQDVGLRQRTGFGFLSLGVSIPVATVTRFFVNHDVDGTMLAMNGLGAVPLTIAAVALKAVAEGKRAARAAVLDRALKGDFGPATAATARRALPVLMGGRLLPNDYEPLR